MAFTYERGAPVGVQERKARGRGDLVQERKNGSDASMWSKKGLTVQNRTERTRGWLPPGPREALVGAARDAMERLLRKPEVDGSRYWFDCREREVDDKHLPCCGKRQRT